MMAMVVLLILSDIGAAVKPRRASRIDVRPEPLGGVPNPVC
jgi:hypothetical protein